MVLKRVFVKTALLVLGLAPILEAGQRNARSLPTLCPPIDTHLTSTLLDVLIYPGFTGQ